MRTKNRAIAGIFLNFFLCCQLLILTLENISNITFKCQIYEPGHSKRVNKYCCHQIREDICREAAGAAMIAIMVDDTKDISQKEQMSLCIRFTLLPGNVREQFLMLKHMTDDAKSLSEAIYHHCNPLGLIHAPSLHSATMGHL